MSITVDKFFESVYETLNKIKQTQWDNIMKAADLITESLMKGGLLHTFGTGHSEMVAEDAWSRAGGLAVVNLITGRDLATMSGISNFVERIPQYADALLASHDINPKDAIIIISNSGINALPVEMALRTKQMGLKVIAITNLAHSKSSKARGSGRHPSGKRLFEVADVVLDNCGVPGDAVLEIEGLPVKGQRAIGTSTIAGTFIINAVIAQVILNLVDKGVTPPVLISGNIEVTDEDRKRMLDAMMRWKDRMPVYEWLHKYEKLYGGK